ncbi:MAG: DMT family transporter [Proteobacteria bacterium]|nr:DMT family transporter [Pseudomonadota bacterium]MBI3495752.1 DMT family transporter [Pseudomonadota bacterium]
MTIVFYYGFFCTLVLGLVQPFSWTWPDWRALLLFALLGTLGGVAQYFLTQAYRFAPASLVAPFDYSQLVWTAAFGFLVFGDLPALATWMGALLIAGSGVYIFQREARGREKPSTPA